jgi:hypothetical protein
MEFRIVLKEGFKNHIEELRALHGDYHPEVYFWDVVRNEKFVSEEEAKEFICYKIAIQDNKRVEIVEEKE